MRVGPLDDPKRYERVEGECESVEDEFGRVEEENEEVEDVEVVGDGYKVIAKPIPREEVVEWADAVYQYRRLETRAGKLREDIKFFEEAEEKPRGCDVEKIRKHLKKLKRELNRVRKAMRELALKVHSNCARKHLGEGACDNCPNADICLRALKYLEGRRRRKVRGQYM